MQELKALPIWFLWRKEMDGDRINKIPFAAGGGATGTNEKYRHTWVTYEEAVAAAKMVGAAGVGFGGYAAVSLPPVGTGRAPWMRSPRPRTSP